MDATAKQMDYLHKLVADSGQEIHQYLIDHGISKMQWGGTLTAERPSKAQASELISELAPSLPQGRQSYGRRARR